ncbi:MAG: sensor histidine kinase, partial [Lachnospiraceae bacterium]
LDTKLKNRHKLAILIMILAVLIPAEIMVEKAKPAYEQMMEWVEEEKGKIQCSEEFMEKFVEAVYVLYNTEQTEEGSSEHAKQVEDLLNGEGYESYCVDYGGLDILNFLTRVDYRVLDENGQDVTKIMASNASEVLNEKEMNYYGLGVTISYDEHGLPTGKIKKSNFKQKQNEQLRKCLAKGMNRTALLELSKDQEYVDEPIEFKTPRNRTYYFAISRDELENYVEEYMEISEGHLISAAPDWMMNLLLFCMLGVALVALVLPSFKRLCTGDEKVFLVPFEIPIAALFGVIALSIDLIGVWVLQKKGSVSIVDHLIWITVFAVIYWSVTCLRHIFSMGPKQYILQYSLIVTLLRVLKKETKKALAAGRNGLDNIYHSFDEIDFREQNNKAILKIVGLNFGILFLITCMWFVGTVALIIYSVLLFFILRKYFNDLKGKYERILNVTNQMAEGKLDVELDEDLGVFNSFKNELVKIQDGYQKAVEKEVKSQRMKTELITNVSHDLKTPLTAIITYVNLLKDEKDENKQKEYIDVLERKSMRLKALIEDLFEVSKASSKDVTLHLSDVDVVNLFKQVHLELAEKCDAADLDFRCTYPEEKLVSELDGQKTYRIFENLLVNVTKYAMPGTRVYVKIEKEEDMVSVQIMNISVNELKVSGGELTERFVRGDLSRNTEGSGLGLAIAKSFTELQKGSFRIDVEGDLFKVKVTFPLKNK